MIPTVLLAMPYVPLRVLSRVVAVPLDRKLSLSFPVALDVVAFSHYPDIRGDYCGNFVYFPHLPYTLAEISLFRKVFANLPILSILYHFPIDLTCDVH